LSSQYRLLLLCQTLNFMKRGIFTFLFILTLLGSTMAQTNIKFEVSFTEPQAHYADIKMHISDIKKDYIDVKMPVWSPGSYLVREYAKNVERLSAQSPSGTAIPVEKVSKNTWRIHTKNQKQVEVNYSIYGFEVSVRTNYIDDTHAFLQSTATFMHVDGELNRPVTVAVKPFQGWSKVSTGLKPIGNNTYTADNFDILYDSPIEIGNQDVWNFTASGVDHEFAMVGGGNYNKEQLTQDVTKIVDLQTQLFGVNPNDRYVFITHNYQTGGGGLEHLNSTVLGASRNGYNSRNSYNNFLALVSHEYFHLWNVKRLRVAALGPFDYDAENYTEGLWIMEGFTGYYDNQIVRRAGFTTAAEYLSLLASDFNAVYNRPGYAIQTVAESSYDAWIKQYRPDENSANTGISYYNKGSMLAAALDVKIIAATQGKKRLDDVMRAAYEQFYVKEKRGFKEAEFQALAEKVAGIPLNDIFEAAHQHKELDYNQYFNQVGYKIFDSLAGTTTVSLGATFTKEDARIIVKNIERDAAAWKGGLSAKDEVIAINGTRLDTQDKELDYILRNSKAGDVLTILVARDGLIKELKITLQPSSKKAFKIEALSNSTDAQRQLGQIWLGIK